MQFGSSHTSIGPNECAMEYRSLLFANVNCKSLSLRIAQQWMGARFCRCCRHRHHVQSDRNVTIYLLFELAQPHLFFFSMIISHIWTILLEFRITQIDFNASIAQSGNIKLPFCRGFVHSWNAMKVDYSFICIWDLRILHINRLIELMVWSRKPSLPIAPKVQKSRNDFPRCLCTCIYVHECANRIIQSHSVHIPSHIPCEKMKLSNLKKWFDFVFNLDNIMNIFHGRFFFMRSISFNLEKKIVNKVSSVKTDDVKLIWFNWIWMQTLLLLLLHALACASVQSTEKGTTCKIIILLKWIWCRTWRFNKAEWKQDKSDTATSLAGLASMILNSGTLSCISFSVVVVVFSFVNLYAVFTLIIAIASSHKQPSSARNTIKTTPATLLVE